MREREFFSGGSRVMKGQMWFMCSRLVHNYNAVPLKNAGLRVSPIACGLVLVVVFPRDAVAAAAAILNFLLCVRATEGGII